MKFFITAAAFIGAATAAGTGASGITTVNISDASIRDNNGLQSVSFTANGIKCSASAAALGSRQIACPGSEYAWHLDGSNSDYTLTLFKGVVTGAPQASGKIPVYCHAGGDGVNDKVCTQTGAAAIAI